MIDRKNAIHRKPKQLHLNMVWNQQVSNSLVSN